MRYLTRRPQLIVLGAAVLLIVLILGGGFVYRTTGSLLGFGESAAERVSLQTGDLPPGMTRCTWAGWPSEKGDRPYGATDVWTAVYADSCDLPPSRRYAFSSVLEFANQSAAVAGYREFVGSPDCTIEHGCVGGLGQNSNVNCGPAQGSTSPDDGSCLGTWQRNAFVVTFQGIMKIDEARRAMLRMDGRAFTA